MASGAETFFTALRQREDRGRAAAFATGSGNPDQAGRANTLSRETGLPPETVERNMGEVEARAERANTMRLIDRYPAIGQWTANERNAAVLRGDVSNVRDLARAWGRAASPQFMTSTRLPFTLPNSAQMAEAQRAGGANLSPEQMIAYNAGAQLNAYIEASRRDANPPPFTSESPSIARNLAAGFPDIATGLMGAASSFFENDALRGGRTAATINPALAILEAPFARIARAGSQSSRSVAADIAGDPARNRIVRDIASGVRSVPVSVAALGLSAIGAPTAGAGLVGAVVQGDAYENARTKGLSPVEALGYSGVQGGIELVTERIPALRWFEDTAAGRTFRRRLFNNLMTEMPQEQVATALQDLNDWASLHPDRPFSEYLAERPDAALSTAIATAAGSVVSVSAVEGAQRAAKAAIDRIGNDRAADDALIDNARLSEVMDRAADSKVRQRDPEAFAALMEALGQDANAENVFVSGEALRELYQANDIDWRDDAEHWFSFDHGFADQLDEALATGGDVVIPTSQFIAHIAGTPAWDALREDVRTSAGGMSPAEARAYSDNRDGDLERLGSEIGDDIAASVEQAEPRERVYGEVRDQLTNAGFAQDAADRLATLVASSREAWGQRLGTDAWTYHAANPFDVQRVLPERLARAQAADGLDMVVAAMRRNHATPDAAARYGSSLLDWISSKGGIEDDGGELASLGADRWHRGKSFRRRLVRPVQDRRQGSMLGAAGGSQFSPDQVFARAIDEGYFPEFAGQRDSSTPGNYAELPDLRTFYAAIEAEMAGQPRYARDTTVRTATDETRDAADDLFALLDARGIDPLKATKKEIRAALDEYRDEQTDGRSYEQSAVGEINDVLQVASEPGNKQAIGKLGSVSDWLADEAGKAGLDIRGFEHVIDSSAVRHIRKEHATPAREIQRGQIPVDDIDFRSIPAVLLAPDKIVLGTQSKLGRDQIAYVKRLADGTTLVIEEARTGKRQMAVLSMRKYPPAMNADNIVSTLDPNARSNREASAIVVDVPTGIKAASSRSLDQSARGRITFQDARAIIQLFEDADLSTFIHELGHFHLEELFRAAALPDAPSDVVADRDAVAGWFAENGVAVGPDGRIPTDAHELFARGFERYAMEGKAPSTTLRRAFDAFRGWLLRIYQVVNNLRTPITPEIRDVMDRLLATQEEIDAARQRQAIESLFTDAAQAGMTDAEFAAYRRASSDARDEAFDALLYRTMERIRRSRTAAWKDEQRTVSAEVTARINAMPDFRAVHVLRTGRWLGEPDRTPVSVKLDRQWLVDTYGEDALSMLPRGVPPIYSDTNTMPADEIAEMVGFRTGDEMVRRLMAMEEAQRQAREDGDKRSLKERLIEQEVADIMTERHGDPLNDGSIEEEALAAIHNERQGEVIASELRALRRRSRDTGAPTAYQVARDWASRKIAEGKVADSISGMAIQRYARAAAKAGRAAEVAMLEGNVEETFRQKQAQMLNGALVAEAKSAAERVQTIVSRLSRVADRRTMKSVDQEYLDRAHAMLAKFDFRSRTQRAVAEQEGFVQWMIRQQANGIDVIVPPRLEDRGEHYSRLSVQELIALDESVAQVMHLGRTKQKLLDLQDEREFDEVVGEALAGMSELPERPASDLMEPSWWDAVKSGVASAEAGLLKMETIFHRLDGGKSDGVFGRVVFQRLATAQENERRMLGEYVMRFRELLERLPKKTLARWSEKVIAQELLNRDTGNPWVLTRDQLISMALNMGNASNAEKLAGGYGWSETGILTVLERELTAEEWDFVQATFDLIEGLWPQIAAMEKRINGVVPEKIDARPIGPIAGGYFPVIYDARKSIDADVQSAKNSDALFEDIYTRAATPRGFTIERTKVVRPIHLSLGIIQRHLGEVIHDLTHREAIIDADRFLGSRRIMEAVDATLGPEIRKQFRPWLQHIANEWAIDRSGNRGLEKVLKGLRTNTTIVGMGYRVSTILMQLAGYSNSFETVGTAHMMRGVAATMRNPVATSRFVLENSQEVRGRMETLDRDIRDNVRRVLGQPDPLSAVKRFAFHGIGYMDRAVVVPTWIAAFNKATVEGAAHDQAVAAADKAVRQSQGAGAAKDLAAIQRGTGKAGEALKLLTMFYSYMSAFYQRTRILGWDASDAVRNKDIGALPGILARAWWLFIVPPVLSELLAGRGPDDDEDWGMWAAQKSLVQLFGPIPLARDFIEPALNKAQDKPTFGYKFTPAQSGLQTAVNLAGDIGNLAEGEPTKRATRDAIETLGYFTGLTTGQMAVAVQFLVDVGYGEQEPESVADWYQGLTKGKFEQRD